MSLRSLIRRSIKECWGRNVEAITIDYYGKTLDVNRDRSISWHMRAFYSIYYPDIKKWYCYKDWPYPFMSLGTMQLAIINGSPL